MEHFAISLAVPHAGAAVKPGHPGIVCAGRYSTREGTGLVVIADGRAYNTGASATNAMDTVLGYLAKEFGHQVPLQRCQIVEIDSDGCFDRVIPAWSARGELTALDFAPLLHADAAPRTEEGFLREFGETGKQVLGLLDQAGPYGPA